MKTSKILDEIIKRRIALCKVDEDEHYIIGLSDYLFNEIINELELSIIFHKRFPYEAYDVHNYERNDPDVEALLVESTILYLNK